MLVEDTKRILGDGAVDGLYSTIIDAGPRHQHRQPETLQALQALDVGRQDFPPRDHEHGVGEASPIQFFERCKEMVLYTRQERIGRPVKDLYGSRADPESPVVHQLIHRLVIAQHQMRLFHFEILEQVTHTVTAVERASHNMIETEAGLTILDHVPKCVRKVDWGGSKFLHGA
jgi:hypothetical protein